METVELSLTNMETAVSDGALNSDDFSVDDLLDFSNDDVFVEDGGELKFQRNKGVSVSSNDETTLNPSKDFSTACELAVPTDDLAELEWLSNFVDDSSFAPYSARTKKPVWLTGDRRHPVTPVHVGSCFKAPLPVKIRTERQRTGVNLWSSRSPSLTDSSSSSATSSSSSSGHSSPLWLSGAEFLDEKAVKRQRKKKKKPLSSLEAQWQTRRCSHCGVQKTPQWRAGPLGRHLLYCP